jgi:hypothetical protein
LGTNLIKISMSKFGNTCKLDCFGVMKRQTFTMRNGLAYQKHIVKFFKTVFYRISVLGTKFMNTGKVDCFGVLNKQTSTKMKWSNLSKTDSEIFQNCFFYKISVLGV